MFNLMPFDRGQGDLFHYLDNIEKNFFGDFQDITSFRTDVMESNNGYKLQAELPGFKKEDIHIDLNGEQLTISAQHSEENKEEKDNYIRRERKFGSFSRTFNVSGIETSKIQASYKDGILELTLPKAAPAVPTSNRIAIQ